MLRPRRRGLASINSEIRDGIVPAAGGLRLVPSAPARQPRRELPHRRPDHRLRDVHGADGRDGAGDRAADHGARFRRAGRPRVSSALTSYLLALAIFIPASGRLADRFGSKTVFRLAIVHLPGRIAAVRPGPEPAVPGRRALPAGRGRGDDDPGRPSRPAAQRRQGGHGPGHVLAAHARPDRPDRRAAAGRLHRHLSELALDLLSQPADRRCSGWCWSPGSSARCATSARPGWTWPAFCCRAYRWAACCSASRCRAAPGELQQRAGPDRRRPGRGRALHPPRAPAAATRSSTCR